MSLRWKVRESLLQQGAANATGTKFYLGGVAHDDQTGMWFGLINFGMGTGALDFTSGQVQCLGAFSNEMAAQSAVDHKLTLKQRRGYNPYNDSHDQTELLPRIAGVAMAAHNQTPATPVTAPPPANPDSLFQRGQADAVARLLSVPFDATAQVEAIGLRDLLLDKRNKLLAEMDTIDSQVDLLNARLIS